MTVYVQTTLDTAGKLLNASSLVPFITSMLCLTLVMNVLTTGKPESFSVSDFRFSQYLIIITQG